MATNFPSSLDTSVTLPAEGASTPLATNHVTAHQNIQDALEAVEAKVGVDGSAVTTSHDYKLSGVTGSDKAVSKTGTETLTNKTLTAPVITSPKITVGSDAIGDLHYTSNADGTQSRLGVGSNGKILKLVAGLPSWETEVVTVNGDTTTAGIFEEATSAEVTAGTATGGTGASLVVTPDGLAASTPVFDGSGLTNIPRFLTSGAPGTTTTNTTATVLTYSLAGGVLGTNKGVRLKFTTTIAISATNSGVTYTLKYGGTSIASWSDSGSSGTPTVTSRQVVDVLLMGSGSTGTQHSNRITVYGIESGSGGTASTRAVDCEKSTSSIDSTTSQNITLECVAAASTTGTLVDYFIDKVV
jgi:hypothetical protein